MSNELKIFTGTANTALTHEICEYLDCELGKSSITRFSDGEIYFQILENVRGADVFIVQPTLSAGRFESDRAVPDDRCVQARIGASGLRR